MAERTAVACYADSPRLRIPGCEEGAYSTAVVLHCLYTCCAQLDEQRCIALEQLSGIGPKSLTIAWPIHKVGTNSPNESKKGIRYARQTWIGSSELSCCVFYALDNASEFLPIVEFPYLPAALVFIEHRDKVTDRSEYSVSMNTDNLREYIGEGKRHVSSSFSLSRESVSNSFSLSVESIALGLLLR